MIQNFSSELLEEIDYDARLNAFTNQFYIIFLWVEHKFFPFWYTFLSWVSNINALHFTSQVIEYWQRDTAMIFTYKKSLDDSVAKDNELQEFT